MSKQTNETYEGTVKWFNDSYGYGFISCPQFEKDIFAHFSRIQSREDRKTLSKGQKVNFEVTIGDKGLQAVNIREVKVIPTQAKIV